MSSAEIDRRLARFVDSVQSDREVLRRKVGKLLREFNGGHSRVNYGPFHIDIVAEFEGRLNNLSDGQVRHILDILRE